MPTWKFRVFRFLKVVFMQAYFWFFVQKASFILNTFKSDKEKTLTTPFWFHIQFQYFSEVNEFFIYLRNHFLHVGFFSFEQVSSLPTTFWRNHIDHVYIKKVSDKS